MQRASNRNGVHEIAFLLDDLAQIALVKASTLGDLGDDLLVVIGKSEMVGQALAKLASSTSKLASNGNDLVQNRHLLDF